jgi:ubiquinone/menaquinone biosynthesis C-methylase UbiE
MRALCLAWIVALGAFAPDQAPQGAAPGRLFRPEELGQLEGPDRDEWQQPERIMDALEIAYGDKVADLGAGGGWFTERLAYRVGPSGLVYAEDIQQPMIMAIEHRMANRGLKNVRTKLGTPSDPRLPAGQLQAVLAVDLYSQLGDPVTLLKNVKTALAPNGRLGIVDFLPGAGGPGPAPEDRRDAEIVIRVAELAGLRLKSHETFLRYQYLLVFVK